MEEGWEKECPTFVLSKEKARMHKPWRRTLIIKLLGNKIGYKALKPRMYKMWAKDDVLDIIDLTHDSFMIKFNAYLDYESAFIGGSWLIYGYYLIVRPWVTYFDLKEDV